MNHPVAIRVSSLLLRIPRRVRGMLLAMVAAASFTLLHTSVRYATQELHVLEVTFFRFFFALLLLLPGVVRSRLKVLKTSRLHLHLIRCVLVMLSMMSLFTALSITPLAQVTALSFIAPVFGTIMAILILKERSTLSRWLAVLCGFVGMLVVLRPGIIEITLGPLLAVFGALMWGLSTLVIKMMARTESSHTQVTYMAVIVAPMTAIGAWFVWQWPSWQVFPVLVFMALIATAGQFAYTKSFMLADATALMPLDFTRMVWASVLGYLLFGEIPALWTWVGGIIIFCSAVYITLREARSKPLVVPEAVN